MQAAWGAIEAYLQLARPPGGSEKSQGSAAAPGTPEITPEERKRLKQKQRKVSSPHSMPRAMPHDCLPCSSNVY